MIDWLMSLQDEHWFFIIMGTVLFVLLLSGSETLFGSEETHDEFPDV